MANIQRFTAMMTWSPDESEQAYLDKHLPRARRVNQIAGNALQVSECCKHAQKASEIAECRAGVERKDDGSKVTTRKPYTAVGAGVPEVLANADALVLDS